MRGLSAFADRPDDKRLTAPHVAARKDFVERALVGAYVGGDVAALIESDAELLDHAVVNRRDEAHGEENEIGLELELRAGDRLHLAIDFHASELLDEPVLANEFARQHGEIARRPLFMRRRGTQFQRPVRPGQELILLFRWL